MWSEFRSPINEHDEELMMTIPDKTGITRPKRLSKSERTHRRRLKQAAGKPAGEGVQGKRAPHRVKAPEATQ
jgi:hypothetical protein